MKSMSNKFCKKNTQKFQSTNKLLENMCKYPEAFATGLGKNIKVKKNNKRKYKQPIEKDRIVFDHSKRQEGYYTQSSIFSAFNRLTLPGQFQQDVKEIVSPLQDLNSLISGPEFMTAINNFNKVALNGIHVNHSLGINDEVILVMFIVALIGSHYSKNNSLKVIASLGSLVFTLKLVKPGAMYNIYSYIFDKIKENCASSCNIPIDNLSDLEKFYETDDIVTQAIDMHLAYRLIVLAVSSFTIAKNYGEVTISTISKIDKVAKTLSPITSLFKSGGDILSTVLSCIEGVVNTIGKWFNDEFRFAFGGEVWYELEILRNKLIVLKEAFDKREDLGDIARKARALKSDLLAIKVPKDGIAYTQYRDLSNNIHVICDDLARLGAVGNDIRKEPLVIVLSGTPGVGKSIVSQHILDIMAYEILGKEQYGEYKQCSGTFIYPPNQTEKFMSGYTNQPLVTLDDLGYSPESIETMVPRFISMVNSMPYSVEQAELHRKGNVYFDSKLILATSNIFNWANAANKLTSTEALCRRMHICIRVSCKAEYAKSLKTEASNYQLDPLKVKNFDACEWCDFSVYDPEGKVPDHDLCFHSLDCKCDGPECRKANFADLAKLCVLTYRRRNEFMVGTEVKRKDKLQRMCNFEGDTLDMIGQVHDTIVTQGPCDKYCIYHNGRTQDIDDLISDIIFDVREGKVCNQRCCHSIYTYEMFGAALKDPSGQYLPFDTSKLECIRDYRSSMPLMDNCMLSTFEYLNMMKSYKKVDEEPSKFYHALRYCKKTTHLAWQKIEQFCESNFFKKFVDILSSPMTLGVMAIGISVCVAIGLFSKMESKCDTVKEVSTKNNGFNNLFAQSIDHNALDVMKALATNNVMHLFYDGQYGTTVLGVMNEVILLNQHAYDKLKVCASHFDLYKQGKSGKQWRYACEFGSFFKYEPYIFENQDLVAVKLDGLLVRDITHLFSDDVFTSANSKNFGISWFNPYSNDHEYNCFVGLSKQPLNIMGPIRAKDEETDKTYVTTSWIKYDIPTVKGMCGAPVVLMDASNKKKFVGIHCAGNNSDGYGVRVTLRQIKEVARHFKTYVVQTNVSLMSKENIFYDVQPEKSIDNCQVIGKVNATQTILKSEIIKSPVYGRLPGVEPNLMPAILVPRNIDGVLVDPIEKNLEGYARGLIVPDEDVLKGVVKSYISKLAKVSKPPKLTRFLTFEESVKGCPELPFVRSLNRGTSGGYPDKIYLKDKKRSAFGYDEVFTFDTTEAIQQRETWNEAMLALKNGPIEMVANIFPKDELRPIVKAKQLKTRLIAGFSCSATLVIRSVFGPMVDWFSCDENRINNCSAVGVNPASSDWAKIALKMGFGAPDFDVKAGDYSSFDKTLNPFFMNSVFKVWMEFFGCRMTEEERTIADNCWKSILNVVVVCKDNLVFWGNSNPSGNPLTTIINTISNVVILMYGITKVSIEPKDYIDVYNFWNKVGDDIQFICYGDDNIFSVNLNSKFLSDKPKISYENLGNALSLIGFVYTDESKSDSWNEVKRSVFDVSFLKRTFYKEGSNVLAPLDINSITQKIQWKKRKDPNNDLFFIKFSGFIAELSVHPKDTYDHFHKLLFDALESAVPCHPISRSQTQTEWREHWSKVCEPL